MATLFVVAAFCLAVYYLATRRRHSNLSIPPGPREGLSSLRALRARPCETYARWSEVYGE